MKDPYQQTDDTARALALSLVTQARHAALGVLTPDTHAPMVTRVAMLWHGDAALLLVSDLSSHTEALTRHPACSLLVGDVGPKGDPLTHPRLTLQTEAAVTDKQSLKDIWLGAHPKSKLYFDFADFRMMRLSVTSAFLNGGFGRAFRLTAQDLQI